MVENYELLILYAFFWNFELYNKHIGLQK